MGTDSSRDRITRLRPIDQLVFSQRRDYVMECNWKVYVDNYLEGYHLPTAHPGLFGEIAL